MKVAVIGASGAVGREMIRILDERGFPADEFLPLASARSAGRTVRFRGADHAILELSVEALQGTDVALVSAGATVSRAFIPQAAANGTTCIDNSSAFRMDPAVPLVVPDVNPEALAGEPKIVSVPNCTTITAVLPLGPLHRAAGLVDLSLSSYQSVSGAGHRGVAEMVDQISELHGREDEFARMDPSSFPSGPVFGKTIAFNVLAKVGEFEPGGYTGEEAKMMAEPRKILGLPDLPVVATSVRVPVPVGHAVTIIARFSRAITPGEAREILSRAPGVEVRDDPANGIYPSPLEAAGGDTALVGRIRQVEHDPNSLVFFSCADNLRQGAALDAVLIAEHLFT